MNHPPPNETNAEDSDNKDGDKPPPLPQTALSAELIGFQERLDGKDTTLGEMVELIGDRGFGLLLILLALPAALPVPAVGYATPFGLVMAFLGLQLAGGRVEPWIPKRFKDVRLPYRLVKFSISNARLPLKVVEVLVRPRWTRLAKNRAFLAGVGITIAMLSLFMSMPIPLTNTAPSFVIFILAAGMLEEDGLILLGGLLLAPVAIGIAGLAIYAAIQLGDSTDGAAIKDAIKSLFQ